MEAIERASMGMPVIADLSCRRTLNSHVEWTPECEVVLSDGRSGRGTAPRGETPSIYEDGQYRPIATISEPAIAELIGLPADQELVDRRLRESSTQWGHALTYAVSVALFEALRPDHRTAASVPRILFNLLNGGLHAYTNPIRCDVTEVLLVPRHDDMEAAIDGYRRLLDRTREALAEVPQVVVNGNPVHDLGGDGDDSALKLATRLLREEGLDDAFRLMVDASAGDWWTGTAYRLPVSGADLDRRALVRRWLDMMNRYDLVFLEDPLAETDVDGWMALHEARPAEVVLLADNFTSTRIDELRAKRSMIDGVLIKPDQNGTVSGTIDFAAAGAEFGLIRVASHRSIETDSPFLIELALDVGADWVKIGPFSDFSSILRTNALLRARE